ncbi:mco [Symbiodinium natans]|uniref:Mco protein n=1 Tax=Symbiodinium natans TaxID=878477 RepID=A0A812GMN0_9DINO|nr:mco [Symbiodinium natans]
MAKRGEARCRSMYAPGVPAMTMQTQGAMPQQGVPAPASPAMGGMPGMSGMGGMYGGGSSYGPMGTNVGQAYGGAFGGSASEVQASQSQLANQLGQFYRAQFLPPGVESQVAAQQAAQQAAMAAQQAEQAAKQAKQMEQAKAKDKAGADRLMLHVSYAAVKF